jgi:GNAT superfamily N-acetyltransferase
VSERLRRPRYGERVPEPVEIAPLSAPEELERLLPAIADYQRFYEVEEIDEGRNRTFFARFLSPSDDGMILAARSGGEGAAGNGEPLGYACLYWHLSSLAAAETVLMNDLFVLEAARGKGVGRALIEASASVARERGAHSLEWSTAPTNTRAQALYDSTGATQETWLSYELPL